MDADNLALLLYAIYDNPADFPGMFVVRRFVIPAADAVLVETNVWSLSKTLDEARRSIPPGYARVDRQLHDDPVIVEVWL